MNDLVSIPSIFFRTLVFLFLLSAPQSFASNLSSSFTLDGQLSDQSLGGPLLDGDIRISVQILDPLKQCVLFEEIHKVSTVSSNGYYRLLVGSSALTAPADASVFPRRGPLDSSHTLTRVSQNTTALAAKGGACGGSNYTPQSGEGRFLRLIVTPSSLGIAHQLSPDTELGAVPQAMVAESVQGYKANQLLIVDAAKNMTQGSVSGFFAALDANGGKISASLLPALPTTSLSGVAVGNTGKYLSGDGTWQDLPSGTVPAWNDVTGKPATFPPSTHTHAVGDITGVLTISQGGTGLSAACSDGQVLKSASGSWVCGSDENTTVDATKLPLTGGTLSGALNMGSQNIESAGHITISSQRTLRFGGIDNANQGALGLNPGHAGSTWYNSDRKALTYWDGLAVREVVGLATPSSAENGQSLRWNNTSGRWEYFTAGAAGAGIATLNGLAGNDQLFAINTSASVLTPTWSSVGTTHTLQIPLANQASVTAGLVTNAELTALQAKQSALTAGLDGHFLKSNGTIWSPANITFADIKNNSSGNAFDLANCGSGKTIEWISTLDRIQCVDIAISQSQVTGLTAALADKVDASAMTTALAAKVETTALTAALSGKADTTAMTTALSGKADTTALTSALSSKADTTALANYIPTSQKGVADGVVPLDATGKVAASYLPATSAPAWGDLTGKPTTFSPSAHNHAAAEITSGVLDEARLPAGVKHWQTEAGHGIRYDAGNVVIGSQSASLAYRLDVGDGTLHAGSAAFEGSSNDKNGPTFSFWKHRNYGAIELGDELGYFSFWGRNEAAMQRAAAIVSQAEANFNGTTTPASLIFHTRDVADGDVVERMRIRADGRVGIGIDSPEKKLHVAGGIKATEICIDNDCKTAWPSSAALTDGSVTTLKLATEVADKLLPSAATTGQFLRSNGTVWSGAVIKLDDIKNSSGGASAFNFAACGPNKTLGAFNAPLDQFSCVNIAITKSQVSDLQALGTAASETSGTGAGHVLKLDGSARAPASIIQDASSTLSGLVNTATQSFGGAKTFISGLLVQGTGLVTNTLQVTSGSPGDGKVLTSDASGNASWQTPTGGGARGYKAISANYTVLAADVGRLLDVTNGVTVTLPSAATVGAGFMVSLKRTASSLVTITTTSSQTIDGISAYKLSGPYSGVVLVSTGTHWIIESKTSSNDPCQVDTPIPGTMCPSGAIYLGSLSPGATSGSGTDYYMTTPGGCTDSSTPTCNGTTDILTKTWNNGTENWYDITGLTNFTETQGGGYGMLNTDNKYGSANTTILAAITASNQGGQHQAARYCENLMYAGYSDWYLPNRYELNLFWINKSAMMAHGLNTELNAYWSSTEASSEAAWLQTFFLSSQGGIEAGMQFQSMKDDQALIRCVRRY